tara:strand:+ start:1492 stop:1764 length:273 start_codon:yes stop_codon:yes gene_type:complete
MLDQEVIPGFVILYRRQYKTKIYVLPHGNGFGYYVYRSFDGARRRVKRIQRKRRKTGLAALDYKITAFGSDLEQMWGMTNEPNQIFLAKR